MLDIVEINDKRNLHINFLKRITLLITKKTGTFSSPFSFNVFSIPSLSCKQRFQGVPNHKWKEMHWNRVPENQVIKTFVVAIWKLSPKNANNTCNTQQREEHSKNELSPIGKKFGKSGITKRS